MPTPPTRNVTWNIDMTLYVKPVLNVTTDDVATIAVTCGNNVIIDASGNRLRFRSAVQASRAVRSIDVVTAQKLRFKRILADHFNTDTRNIAHLSEFKVHRKNQGDNDDHTRTPT